MSTGNDFENGQSTPRNSAGSIELQRISLTRFFSATRKAGIDIRPLTTALSTLQGESSEGLALLGLSYGVLSTTPNLPTTKKTVNAIWQMKLSLQNAELIDSMLRELSECSSDRASVGS